VDLPARVAISLDIPRPFAAESDAAVPRGARLALRFVALTIVTGTAAGVMQLGVPLLALSVGATHAEVGLLRSVSGMGMLLVVLPVGLLVDRFGAGRIFRIGALAGSAIALVYASAPPSLVLVVLMALEGVFAPLRFTALSASYYGKLASIGLDKAGWFKASMSVGLTFLGPLLGGMLARGAGFPALFGVVLGLHLGSAVLGAAVDLGGARTPSAPHPRLRDQVAELRALLRSVALRPILAAELLGAATFSAFTTTVVVLAMRVLGADAAVTSRVLIVEGLAFVLSALLGSRLAATRGRLVAAGLAGAAGVVGTALAPGPISLAIAGIAVGIATGLLHVHVASWVGAQAGPKGRIAALFQVAAGSGITAGPLACALAGWWLPTGATLLVLVPFFLALAWRGVRDTPPDHTRRCPMSLERQQIPQYLDETRFIVLSTVDGSNAPATRTLASFAADGLTVYFSTGKASDKVVQIGGNPNVSVLFQHEKQELPAFANVEIRGVAEVLADGEEKAKAIWLISRRNPRFKERAEKGELSGSALVRVTPKKLKVVDFSRGIGPAAVSTVEV